MNNKYLENKITYEHFVEAIEEKNQLRSKHHYASPGHKSELRARMNCLTKEIMSAPDYYFKKYVLEKKKNVY